MASCASCRVRVVRRGPWARDRAEEGGRADAGRTGWMGSAPCAWRSVRVDSSGWGLGSCCACLGLGLASWSCLRRWGCAPPGQAQGRGSERSAALNFTNTMAIHNGRQRSEDRTAKSPRSCRWHAPRRQSRHDVSRQFDSTQTRPTGTATPRYLRAHADTHARRPASELRNTDDTKSMLPQPVRSRGTTPACSAYPPFHPPPVDHTRPPCLPNLPAIYCQARLRQADKLADRSTRRGLQPCAQALM